MYKEFRHFIEKNQLIHHGQSVLIAVSGGVDSMSMLYLFSLCEWKFAVAHCNFSLRGEESDADEKLVYTACLKLGCTYHTKRFDTLEYATSKNLSVQVAARELRYNWFNELCLENGYDSVAVAHNANDVAETLLINLVRGTGLSGLTGIKVRNGRIIRPLLFATREQIELFAIEKGIAFRNDSSNSENKYIRNRIRNEVLPILKSINPSFIESANTTAKHLSLIDKAISEDMQRFHEKVHSQVADSERYSINLLKQYPYCQEYIHNRLCRFGFSSDTISDIYNSLYSQPGKIFITASHRAVSDREYLFLHPISKDQMVYEDVLILKPDDGVYGAFQIRFNLIFVSPSFRVIKHRMVAYLDFDRLVFPLLIRRWQEGDWFMPFGMKGRKKLSDFLIDNKVPIPEKERISVLISNNQIVWVMGYRIDSRFAITNSTNKVLRIELNKLQ